MSKRFFFKVTTGHTTETFAAHSLADLAHEIFTVARALGVAADQPVSFEINGWADEDLLNTDYTTLAFVVTSTREALNDLRNQPLVRAAHQAAILNHNDDLLEFFPWHNIPPTHKRVVDGEREVLSVTFLGEPTWVLWLGNEE